jgi:NTE family protein
VFICATNVRTGLRRVFNNAELSVDVFLASACLPQIYQAVQIGEDLYWDGGYTGNPALAPFYLRTTATDVIVVGINPIERETEPRTARAIIDRIDEISFNSPLMLELGAIAFIMELFDSLPAQEPFRIPHVHGIGEEALARFGASSKMNNDWAFLQHLHEIGWRVADQWLAENLDAVGNRSTLDWRRRRRLFHRSGQYQAEARSLVTPPAQRRPSVKNKRTLPLSLSNCDHRV